MNALRRTLALLLVFGTVPVDAWSQVRGAVEAPAVGNLSVPAAAPALDLGPSLDLDLAPVLDLDLNLDLSLDLRTEAAPGADTRDLTPVQRQQKALERTLDKPSAHKLATYYDRARGAGSAVAADAGSPALDFGGASAAQAFERGAVPALAASRAGGESGPSWVDRAGDAVRSAFLGLRRKVLDLREARDGRALAPIGGLEAMARVFDRSKLSPTEVEAWKKYHLNAKALGLPKLRAEIHRQPADPGRPTAVVLAPASKYKLSIVAEGGRQAPGDVFLVTDPSWLERYEVEGKGRLKVKRGITFDAKGSPVVVDYETPREVDYFANFYTYGANGRADGVPFEKNLDIPQSNSLQLESIVNEKLLTRLWMAEQGVGVPETTALLMPDHPMLQQDGLKGRSTPGVNAVRMPMRGDAPRRDEIRRQVLKFLETYKGKEVVIKPSGTAWHSGLGVKFFKRNQTKLMVDHILMLAKHGDMTADGAVLIDARITPPAIRINKDGKADPEGEPKDWNIRVLAARTPAGDGQATGLFVRAGRFGIPTTAEPEDPADAAIVVRFEEIIKGLQDQHGLLKAPEEVAAFKREVESIGEKALEAVAAKERELQRKDGEPHQAQTDYLGVDVMLDHRGGKLTPMVIEVNDHDSGGQAQIDEFHPEDKGRHSREWIATMLQRARRHKMRGKTLVIVGAGYKSKRFTMEKAKELGMNIILVDKPLIDGEKNWAAEYADRHIELDPADIENTPRAAFAALRELSKSVKIDGVTTFWENDVPLAAELAERLGLPTSGLKAAELARSKSKTRSAMEAAGLPTPKNYLTKSIDDLDAAIEHVGFPAVLKPVYGAAAMGVVRVNNAREAHEAYEKIREIVIPERDDIYAWGVDIAMEEYLVGDEVDIDVVVQDGKILFQSITDNFPTQEPSFLATGSALPSKLRASDQGQLYELARGTMKALGLNEGVLHIEAKMTPNGPRIIEVNNRMGGTYVHDWVEAVWGVNLVEEQFFTAAGVKAGPFKPERPRTFLSGLFLFPDRTGRLTSWSSLDALEGDAALHNTRKFAAEGSKVAGPEDGYQRIGMVTARGVTFDDAKFNMDRLVGAVEIPVDTEPKDDGVESDR